MNEDYDEDEESMDDGLMISIDENGNAGIHNPKDFIEISEKDFNIIQGFLKENQKEFKKYCEKIEGN